MNTTYTYIKIVILGLALFMVNVASGQVITTKAADVNACPGNLFAVPITVDDFYDVASISLTLDFSNTVISYDDYQNVHAEISGGSLFVNEDNGKIIISWFSLEPANIASGTLMELIFMHNGGDTELEWDTLTPGACQYSDENLNVLPAVFENGSVTDDCNLTISGTITNAVTGQGIEGVTLSFNNGGGTVITDGEGYYSKAVDEGWSGTATPAHNTFTFTPEYREYSNVTSSYTNEDYTGLEISDLPPGWEFTITSGMHIISVPLSANPNIEGEALQSGDYIGVFFLDEDENEICGGAAEWDGNENIPVIAYGDDNLTQEKDGFDENEPFIWKVYSWEDESAYYADATYNQSLPNHDGTYITNGLSALTALNAYETHQHNLSIPQGWSGLSSYLAPDNTNIENIFSPILNDLVILQTLDAVYWPEQGINTIENWSTQSGYKIKLTASNTLTINGAPLPGRTVNLNQGWSIMPVLSECSASSFEVLNPLEDTLIIAKEIGGSRIFWPELEIYTLEELNPGKAYMISVSNSTSITYPDCEKGTSRVLKTLDSTYNTPWNNVTITGSSHVIGIESHAMIDSIYANDVIGIFTNDGLCAGMVEIENAGENHALTAYGDDPTTPEIDGFEENEPMTLKLYRPETDELFNIYPEYDENMPNTEFYETNGLSKITDLYLKPVGLEENYQQFNIYPNPADEHIMVNTVGITTELKFTLCNIVGQPVKKGRINRRQTTINTSFIQEGVYLLKLSDENKVITTNKIIIK